MSIAEQPMSEPAPAEGADGPGRKTLGMWDAVSIIVGIVVGAGIYQTAPFIFKNGGTATGTMWLWGIAGFLSLVGALVYAELASAYPRDGGDINYLNRAFGRWCGFLFGWVQLAVILTGSICMMAFVFANYSIRLCKVFEIELGVIAAFAFAGGAIAVLTITNIAGALLGKVVQNVLTLAKVIGLGAIVVAGFMAPEIPDAFTQPSLSGPELEKLMFPGFAPSIGVALIVILYTYGGWNDAAFVAAEVRDGKRNITLSLIIGLLIITLLYLLVNYAYVKALGFQGAQKSSQIAADVLDRGFGSNGVVLMCVLVMVSSLGAVNGLIFTGARVYSTVGKDYAILGWMSGWNRENAAPVPALITQGVLALALVFLVGTKQGREAINWALDKTVYDVAEKKEKGKDGKEVTRQVPVHLLPPMEWEDSWKAGLETGAGEKATDLAKGGFDTLLACTAPIFWGFFMLTGLSLFALRERDRDLERPFTIPLYPVLPLMFVVMSGYMLYSSIHYAVFDRGWRGGVVLLGVLPLLLGLPLYHISQMMGDGKAQAEGAR
jgi:amino acid transporter